MRYLDRSSERAPKIIEAQWRFGQSLLVREPIVRIRLVVSKIFEQRARVAVRSGPCNQSDLRPRGASEFGRERRSLDLELPQRIRRYQVAESTEEVICGNHCAPCLIRGHTSKRGR